MMGIEKHKKPSGEHIDDMVGPGAWPETDESVFSDRSTQLGAIHTKLTRAKEGWQSGQAYISSESTWAGISATAANVKVDSHTKAMETHEQQLTVAKGWCGEAGGVIGRVKDAIVGTVNTAVGVINETISKANDDNTDPKAAIKNIKGKAYDCNKSIVQWGADTVLGKDGVPSEPPKYRKEHFEDKKPEAGDGDDTKPEDNRVFSFRSAAFDTADEQESSAAAATDVAPPAPAPKTATFDTAGEEESSAAARATGTAPPAPAPKTATFDTADEQATPGPVPVVQPAPPSANPGKPGMAAPPTPAAASPSAPSPSSGGSPSLPGIGGGSGASGGGGASSPLGQSLSDFGSQGGGPTGFDPAQAMASRAPVDPLQEFSKGFADSAGTPVHAASTGLSTPAPAVPASDAMTPASTASAPVSHTSAPAPTGPAPQAAPPSGGSMGGGMPSMPMAPPPLGPPPTPPPAGPVAPPAPPTAAPLPTPPASGGAQVAPIPVSAARAQRDAAQNAAKRSSDPLELARRIAAALNAPDMVNVDDFNFFWITALTADGQIVVANSYGLAFIPEQVQLPEQVKFASADESIPPAERASWATYPIVAVQRWAQHHDLTLRAVIACEHQFTNVDSGVHQAVLAPEDIPAKGKMAGRDRLQVIAPQISLRLAGFSDADLVNVLPPAPTDTNPPEDHRSELWDKVWQPLASSASNRGEAHLRAFLAYAAHAQEYAVYEAHSAVDGPGQRRAVTDFIYWQHVGQLIADAIET